MPPRASRRNPRTSLDLRLDNDCGLHLRRACKSTPELPWGRVQSALELRLEPPERRAAGDAAAFQVGAMPGLRLNCSWPAPELHLKRVCSMPELRLNYA